MNNARRKIIFSSVEELKSIRLKLISIKECEQAALPKFQGDEDKEEAVDAIEELIENLNEATCNIQSSLDTLEGACF